MSEPVLWALAFVAGGAWGVLLTDLALRARRRYLTKRGAGLVREETPRQF